MEMFRPDGISLDDPYVPEAVLKALVVGQRVRYVDRGECEVQGTPTSYATSYGASGHEAMLQAENQVGTIVQTDYHDMKGISFPGHPYFVLMDKIYEFGGQTWSHIVATASELVLIEDE